MEPFLRELSNLNLRNDLYQGWIEYALSLTKDDIELIVRKGLTYQAEALRSMIRELIAGQPVSVSLIKKLDLVVTLARKAASAAK